MQRQVQFCTTSDGVRIAYSVTGEGYPLVLVPGWVSHVEMDMEPDFPVGEMYRRLSRNFTLIRYDKRGTGLSDRKVSDFSLEKRLLDLEALTGALGLTRYAMRGQSEGGPIAIAHAAAHPGRVSHLILQGTFAYVGRTATSDALVSLIEAEWGLGSETMTNIFIPSASKELKESFARYQRESASRKDAAAMLAADLATDVRALLPDVRAKTLVIHSENDRAIPFEQARQLAAAIPNATLARYKGDHAPIGALDDIAQMIEEFLLADVGSVTAPAPPSYTAGMVTIMFTDIEASTSMTQRLGDEAAHDILRSHNDVIRNALRDNGGSEIKHTGDGIMASFGKASSAIACAVEIQRTFDERNAQHPDARVRVRIGLNAGEPVAEDGDLFGTAVQLAARVCARAEPGQVLVSNVVRELAAGKQFLFADQGDVVLRGFEDPVRLYEVSWRG